MADILTSPNGLTDEELATRANECRTLAAGASIAEARMGLLHIAEQYEALLAWRRTEQNPGVSGNPDGAAGRVSTPSH